ncbi:DUF342 domain-containing protein [Vibrio sp. SCSIO 43137]|uniref:DUF342 domain-containing protein n=1 Tax=Vibrio sp. SCSIO 43137 TaxID=3021011 RepID=UPI0023083126|nr:FapA family protein [Vibrio sp. SCSIO 43137]WCE31990.1 FapA family protein [Vibrio sp. SCSIO 43137]
MWKELTRLADDSNSVIAQLPQGEEVGPTFSTSGLEQVLASLGAVAFFYDDEAANQFVRAAKENKKAAYDGVTVAIKKNSEVSVAITDHDMLATMTVTGAYGGKPLSGPEVLRALAEAHVTKGINKLALKKVLSVSSTLAAGETFEQPVAVGTPAKHGKDAQFIPLVDDVNDRVLAPQESDEKTHKVDMRDLGETITVGVGETLMKRVPATKGTPGCTVMGAVLHPKAGKDTPLKEGKGSVYDKKDPNLLRSSNPGMPLIKKNSVDVDPALSLTNIDVTTGHVKFKGSVVVSGNIEPGMVVRATGSLTVGGFIESADVQAQEDIIVGKGIIGHAVDDGEEKACVVKTNGSIKSKYAQYAFLQATNDINLELHCMNSTVMCAGNLTVLDSTEKKGTLGGGLAKAGGNIICANLGVEGDTATTVQAFVRYNKYKQGINELKERYRVAQDNTMEAVRAEIELKKTPKSERSEESVIELEQKKAELNKRMEEAKNKLENAEAELKRLLEVNTVSARNHVYTRVTVLFGDETVITKREHAAALFSFNQYEIKCRSMVEGVDEDEAEEQDL